MNRGVLQSSPVQQMMAGNSNWWSINSIRPQIIHHQQTFPFLPPPPLFPQFLPSSTSSSSSSSSLLLPFWNDNQDQLPESWSQLLMSGSMGDVDKTNISHFQAKKLEYWEEQVLPQATSASVVDVKEENSENSYLYGHANEDFQAAANPTAWSPAMPASSPKSCVTSFSSNMLDFSTNKGDGRRPPPDRSSECNSTATGGAVKKARVQSSSAQPTFKVRKEKLGDRITSLHQLVSPFGKTDTASVLLEAIGYIRFLQSQIEALSLPYLGSGSADMMQQQSLLNDNCIKRKGASQQQDSHEKPEDLRSRGLCLVPVSHTLQVGSDSGAVYWAPALGGGFR